MADIFDQLAADEPKTDIFDQIANEPGFLESLGQGFQRGLKTVGTAKDVLLTEAGVQSPQRTAANIARRAEETAKIPGSVGLREFQESTGVLDALGTLARNPGVIGELTAESLPISGATLVAGAGGGLIGGVPGAAIGAGTVSGTTEYLLALQDQLAEEGVNLQDEERVAQLIADPEFRSRWREKGVKRGAPIGAFDGVMMGVAGRFIGPVRQAAKESGERMIGAQLRALAKETGAQVAGGMGGETTAQLATGGIDSPQSIIAEGAAEIPFSIAEAVTGVKIRNRARSGAAAAQEAASAGMPATASEIVNQTISEIQDEVSGVSTTEEQPVEPATGETLDELIHEVSGQTPSPPDVAGTTETEEVTDEPITSQPEGDRAVQEEAAQETQEEIANELPESDSSTGLGPLDTSQVSGISEEFPVIAGGEEQGGLRADTENLAAQATEQQLSGVTLPDEVSDFAREALNKGVPSNRPGFLEWDDVYIVNPNDIPAGSVIDDDMQGYAYPTEAGGWGYIFMDLDGIPKTGPIPDNLKSRLDKLSQQPAVETAQPQTTNAERTEQREGPLGTDLEGQDAEDQGRIQEEVSVEEVTGGGETAPVPTIQEDAISQPETAESVLGDEGIRREGELPTVGEGNAQEVPSQESVQEEVVSSNLETESSEQPAQPIVEETSPVTETPEQPAPPSNAIEAAQAEFTRLATRGTGENPTPSEIDKIVARLKVPEADVQDVAQDVAVKAATSYNPESGASPLTWVNRIAQSTVADYFRKQSAQKRSAASTVSMETPVTEDETIGETIAEQASSISDAELLDGMQEVRSALSEEELSLLYERGSGATFSEIGKSLGISASAARARYNKAISKAQSRLKSRFGSESGATILFDPKEWMELAERVGESLAQKYQNFTEWAGQMISRFGEEIRKFLRGIWDNIRARYTFLPHAMESGSVGLGTRRIISEARRELGPPPKKGEYKVNPSAQAAWHVLIDNGQLPKDLRRVYDRLQGRIQAGRYRFKQLANDVNRAIQRIHGKDKEAIDAEKERIRQAMAGEIQITSLHEDLQNPVWAFRNAIDTLSRISIDDGIVDGDLAETFREGIGNYMRRGYAVFDPESGWNYKYLVKNKPEILAEARMFLKSEDPKLSDGQVEAIIQQLLDRDTSAGFLMGGRKILGKSIGSLIRRKDIAAPIRRLLGEITDPLISGIRSGDFLTQLTARHAMQQEFRDIGIKSGILSQMQDENHPVQLVEDRYIKTTDEEGNEEFHIQSNRRHDVLRGLWTTPEFRRAFEMSEEMHTPGILRNIVELGLKTWMTLNTMSKTSKTVLNPISYAPNYIGALMMEAMNGRLNPSTWKDAYTALFRGKDLQATVSSAKKAGIKSPRGLYGELLRNQVIDQNIMFNDFKTTVERSFLKAMAQSGVMETIGDIYSAGDNLGKANAYLDELLTLTQAYPEMSFRERSDKAAEIAQNTTPTYSKVPKAMRDMSRAGVVFQSFVNFTYATIRSIAFTAHYARQEIMSQNPVIRMKGFRRLTGLWITLAASSYWGLAAISRILNDIDDEEDQAFRRSFAPPWDKNGNLIYSKFKDGKITYSNGSYLMPQSLFTEVATAIEDGGSPDEIAKRAVLTLFENFIDEGILSSAVLDVLRNKQADSGREVINPELPLSSRVLQGGRYVGEKAFLPGVAQTGWRAYMGITGQAGDFGVTYSAKDELLKVLGYRARTYDIRRALSPRLSVLNNRYRNAEAIQSNAERRGWTGAKLENAIKQSENARMRVLDDYRQFIRDAKTLGIKDHEIVQAMKKARTQNEVRAQVWTGIE
jgi:RNA polymerase sigma factor (sigma-70 family)